MRGRRIPSWWRLAVVMGLALAGLQVGLSWGQAGPTVDAAMRRQVIDGVVREMTAHYVFPEVAARVEAALRDPARRAPLDGLTDGVTLAQAMTTLLQAVTGDKHVRLRFSVQPLPDDRPGGPSAAQLAAFKDEQRARNFGVERVERLPGNIGLIELRGFAPAEWAGASVAAAMTLVAHTDALIVDLRRNGGGDPATVALVSSYLFDERTHLNTMHFRDGNRTEQFWTQDWVSGPRFGQAKPVYVLTSSRTFSGAEEFSYNLQALKRGTVVGEVTGGGAHPGGDRKVATHFRLFVPGGRAVNPITRTNWEGRGVLPDVAVKADDALRVAQVQALQRLLPVQPEGPQRQAIAARLAELDGGAARRSP